MQTLLARLVAGEEDRVESDWKQQLVFGENVRVSAKEWQKHLEHMFVCKLCVTWRSHRPEPG